jgi:hypothetical protein
MVAILVVYEFVSFGIRQVCLLSIIPVRLYSMRWCELR